MQQEQIDLTPLQHLPMLRGKSQYSAILLQHEETGLIVMNR
jgi:hypothetical protein